MLTYHILSYIIIYYHILSYIIIYYHILSYIIIYYHILSYIIIYYHILSYIIIYYHILSYIIIYYHILSYIIIYYGISYYFHIYTYIYLFLFPFCWKDCGKPHEFFIGYLKAILHFSSYIGSRSPQQELVCMSESAFPTDLGLSTGVFFRLPSSYHLKNICFSAAR